MRRRTVISGSSRTFFVGVKRLLPCHLKMRNILVDLVCWPWSWVLVENVGLGPIVVEAAGALARLVAGLLPRLLPVQIGLQFFRL